MLEELRERVPQDHVKNMSAGRVAPGKEQADKRDRQHWIELNETVGAQITVTGSLGQMPVNDGADTYRQEQVNTLRTRAPTSAS